MAYASYVFLNNPALTAGSQMFKTASRRGIVAFGLSPWTYATIIWPILDHGS